MQNYFKSIQFSKILVFSFILLYVSQSISQIFTHSVVFDEPLHIKSGIEWLKTGTSISDPLSPPLSKFPFAIMQLFNINLLDDPYLTISRFTLVFITSIFLIYFYYFVKKHFSEKIALISLLFLVIEPVFIAYTHLANTEAITLISFFLVFALGIEYINKPSSPNKFLLFLFSIVILFLSKTIFLPAFIFIFYRVFKNLKFLSAKLIIVTIFITLLIFISLSLILTGFNSHPVYGSYFNVPGGGILNTTFNSISYVTDPAYVSTRQIIFNDSLSHEGSILYTPLSIFLKTSPILLIFSISFMIFYFWKVKREKMIINQIILLIFTTISLITLGNYNIGIRHLLPLFPFFAILASIMIIKIFETPRINLKIFIITIIFFLSLSNIFTSDKITYFNPLSGNYGATLISESNFDWGQGLPALKDEDIKIDYIISFSPVSPNKYGIYASPLPSDWEKNLKNLKGKNIAISHTQYYKLGYYKSDEFKLDKAEKVANGTLLLFKF